jgi:ABC-type glycerol-3-phosphate transport system permease component|mmetsp:Transcript_102608/g.160102  ORF Transcript_102608/g.160102 Transcript_102608/m.160102 type:complete len:276 (+) Transcript_102608:92-919(+)
MEETRKFAPYVSYGAATMSTKQWIGEYRELFPSLLTISVLAICASSVVNGIRLLQDPDAVYWVGRWAYAVLAIPVIIVVSHVIQSYFRRPLYFAVLVSCVGPPSISFLVGLRYMGPLNGLVGQLQSTDCITFREKFLIEQAYKTAVTFYDDCITALAANSSLSEDALRNVTTISQCPNYSPHAAGFAKEWMYLEALEKKGACSGWCHNDEIALWTHNPTSWTSCSLAAAENIRSRLVRNTWRMMMNGVFGSVVAGMAIILVQEFISNSKDPDLHW